MRVCSSLAAFPISRSRSAVVVLTELSLSLGKSLEETHPVNTGMKEGKHLKSGGKTPDNYLKMVPTSRSGWYLSLGATRPSLRDAICLSLGAPAYA